MTHIERLVFTHAQYPDAAAEWYDATGDFAHEHVAALLCGPPERLAQCGPDMLAKVQMLARVKLQEMAVAESKKRNAA